MFDLRINESGAVGVAGVKLIFAEAPDMDVVGFTSCVFAAQSTCHYKYSPVLSPVPH